MKCKHISCNNCYSMSNDTTSFIKKYRQRFINQWFACGPGSWDTLLVSRNEIERCKKVLKNNSQNVHNNNQSDLNWAKHVKECALHQTQMNRYYFLLECQRMFL